MPSLEFTTALSCALQLADTTSLGDAILGALHGQRRRLEGASYRQQELNEDLSASSTLVERMMRRLKLRHLCWYGIVVLLIVAIVYTLWVQVRARSMHALMCSLHTHCMHTSTDTASSRELT
jgi:hypothetical protein